MNNILRFMIKMRCTWYVISVFHMVARDSWMLKHPKIWNIILIQYITVWNTILIDKYTCTLIYNYAFTQHTHMKFCQKFGITSTIYIVEIKRCHMKQHKISHSWFSNRNIVYMNIMLLVISQSLEFHHNYTNFPNMISL